MSYYSPEEKKRWNQALALIRSGTLKNRKALGESKICGCYQCQRIYPPTQITEWEGSTAICPYCYLTTVIAASKLPFSLDEEYLAYVKHVRRKATSLIL